MDLDEFQKVLDSCADAMAKLPELKTLQKMVFQLTEDEFLEFCEKNHSRYLWVTSNHHATESALGFVAAVQVLLECNESRRIGVAFGTLPEQRGCGIGSW